MSFSSISVLIPVFNDMEVLDELYRRLHPVLTRIATSYEIIFVDDGSSDDSWIIIKQLQLSDNNISGLKLMRNFGQQNAIAAGLAYVSGDIVVIMDSDLQDPPESIPMLVDAIINNNSSMAIAKWKSRRDGFCKRMVSKLFYNVSQSITKIQLQPNLGVFRAIKREVVDEINSYHEKPSTTLSLLHWIGVDYVTVEMERDVRFAGGSGYTLQKMLALSFDRIFSFSMFPIRASIYSGLVISFSSFLYGIYLVVRRLYSNISPGWTSIAVLILFLFGLNFLFLGVIGEYLGRTFMESKQRPKYVVKIKIGRV